MRLKLLIRKTTEKLGAINTSHRFRLLDLPNELIAHIIEQVNSPKALCRLARTCSRLQYLTEPVLYRSILLRDGMKTVHVCNALHSRPERWIGVNFLDVPCDDDYAQHFEAIQHIVLKSKNLKTLMIESPQCNGGNFEADLQWLVMTNHLLQPFQVAIGQSDATMLSDRPLQRLEKLTLHLNGPRSPYWTIDGRSVQIFLHPTLRHLTISCVNISDRLAHIIGEQYNDKLFSTPLKQLEFEECNITHKGLQAILALPKALESLHLGENCHNIRWFANQVDAEYNHLFRTDSEASVQALAQQKHSLKWLAYATPYPVTGLHANTQVNRRHKAPHDGGFADFHYLEEVALFGECREFERALMTTKCPPNLKSIKIKARLPFSASYDGYDDDDTGSDFLKLTPFLRAPSCCVSETLEHLDITFEWSRRPLLSYMKFILRHKNLIIGAAHAAAEMGIRLQVSATHRSQYFPPYLYNEPVPEEWVVYRGAGCALLESLPPREAEASASDWSPMF